MIFGIGTDLCKVARINRVFTKYGEHFVDRLLMPREREDFEKSRDPVRFLAMRFAAKEAIVSRWGQDFAREYGFVTLACTRKAPEDHWYYSVTRQNRNVKS